MSLRPICLLLLLGGCAHETTPPPAVPVADYRLGEGDVIDVAVWKDPALSATVPVRPDGKITVPMVGDVEALGRTTKELEQEVKAKLHGLVSEPVVAVMVKEVHAARFFVLGEVTHPGSYPLTSDLSVIQALAVAGGPTEFARRGGVVVIRRTPGRRDPARYKVDYDDVIAGKAPAITLLAGDTVFVP
jgi:polysaccharide export outer membrane protein